MKIQKVNFTKKLVLGIASVAVLGLTTSVGAWAYTTPYSYVSLDVNPSIEYTLNRFERVIDVKAVNDDGQVIINEIDIDGLNHQSIEKAILKTVDQISQDGYFTENAANAVTGSAIVIGDGTTSVKTIDGGLVITISNQDTVISEELAKELREAVDDFVNANVEVEVTSVGYERVQEAKELGVTPGKLNLVEKLKASAENPDSIVLEEWLNKPVKDIMKAIKENKIANPSEEDIDTTQGSEITLASTAAEIEATTDAEDNSIDDTDKEIKKADKAIDSKAKAEKKALKVQIKAEEKAKTELEKAKEKATAELVKAEEKAKAIKEKAEEKATAELARAEEKAKTELAKANQENAKEKAKAELAKAEEKAKADREKAEEKAKAELAKAVEKAKVDQEKAEEKAQTDIAKAEEKAQAEIAKAEEKAQIEQEKVDTKDLSTESSQKENNTEKTKGIK